MNAGDGPEISSGTLFGGSATAALGRASLTVMTQSGTLTPWAGPDLEREVAEVGLALGYDILNGLTVEGGAQVRTYTVPFYRQRWTMYWVGAAAVVPVAIDGMALAGRAAFKPAVAVTDGADIRLALEGSAGLEYKRGMFGAAVIYSRERYDFAATAEGQRFEQLAGVTMRVGVHLGRLRIRS